MSRFEQEWAVVPTGARWTAVLVALVFGAFMTTIWLLPGFVEPEGRGRGFLVAIPFLLGGVFGVAALAVYVLLVGYVFGDARRRGMNHVLWTLLAVFIPNAIGIILYFILRDPITVPCPACGTPSRKGHAFCAGCGTAVRAACPQCRQAVEPGWRNCARCGSSLAAPSGAEAARP